VFLTRTLTICLPHALMMENIPIVKSPGTTVTPLQAIPASSRVAALSWSPITSTLRAVFDPSSLRIPEACISALQLPDAPPQSPLREYLEDLTFSANNAANSLACGSLLAGQTSESDEYGDVSFWLGEGDYSKGHERDVLKALKLEPSFGHHLEIHGLEMSSAHLPTCVQMPQPTPEAEACVGMLSQLQDVYAFTAEPLPREKGAIAYFLLGHYDHKEGASGWAGLVGVGICSGA